MENHKEIIQTVKGQTCLFIHGNDTAYMSDYLDSDMALAQYTSVGAI
jgi:hypothetical protein